MNWWHLLLLLISFAFGIETGKIRPNFVEIFGEEWDKNGNEEVIDIENSQAAVDQMGEEMGTDPNDQQKIEMIQKFETIKEKLKQKGKYQRKNRNKIEVKIGKLLGANRPKIYKWKKEMNLNKRKIMKKSFYDQKKKEFIERFDEFKSLYGQGKQKEFVRELGISERTFWKWKKELLPIYNKSPYSNEEKLMKMKQYLEIKEGNSKISDELIAKQLGIGSATLKKWKKKLLSNSEN